MDSSRNYNSPDINPDLLILVIAFNHSILYLLVTAQRIGLYGSAGENSAPLVGSEVYRSASPHAPYPRLAGEVHIVGAIVEEVQRWWGEVDEVISSR